MIFKIFLVNLNLLKLIFNLLVINSFFIFVFLGLQKNLILKDN